MIFQSFFTSLTKSKPFKQFLPTFICFVMFFLFIGCSIFFIHDLINPFSAEPILFQFHLTDFLVGFFLYFVTAIDYALIVGRMQVNNPSISARVIMNIFTCLGCFFGVSLVLFLWGFAKEIDWLIIALLIFAGSVMVKLSFEGLDYFRNDEHIWTPLRLLVVNSVTFLHTFTQGLTFWIPELGRPSVARTSLRELAKWSFVLPFIIGLDDFVGYMGAMTIYNVFSLLFGIYLADVLIDIMIFASPKTTKKLVENPVFSFFASLAFIYLMYKSFSEAILRTIEIPEQTTKIVYIVMIVCLVAYLIGNVAHKRFQKDRLVI